MNYKQFKNNNFNVKRDSDHDHGLVQDLVHDGSLDFIVTDTHVSMGNSMSATELVNLNTQCVYLVTAQDEQRYNFGYTVKLVAIQVTEEQLNELLEGEY